MGLSTNPPMVFVNWDGYEDGGGKFFIVKNDKRYYYPTLNGSLIRINKQYEEKQDGSEREVIVFDIMDNQSETIYRLKLNIRMMTVHKLLNCMSGMATLDDIQLFAYQHKKDGNTYNNINVHQNHELVRWSHDLAMDFEASLDMADRDFAKVYEIVNGTKHDDGQGNGPPEETTEKETAEVPEEDEVPF